MRLWLVKKKQALTLGMNMQTLWSGLYLHLRQSIHLKYCLSRKSGISPLLTNKKSATEASCRLEALVYNLLALIWPTIAAPAPLIAEVPTLPDSHRAQQFGLTAPAGLLGAPQLHVPLGPLGVSLLAAPGCDLDLLTTARTL